MVSLTTDQMNTKSNLLGGKSFLGLFPGRTYGMIILSLLEVCEAVCVVWQYQYIDGLIVVSSDVKSPDRQRFCSRPSVTELARAPAYSLRIPTSGSPSKGEPLSSG